MSLYKSQQQAKTSPYYNHFAGYSRVMVKLAGCFLDFYACCKC